MDLQINTEQTMSTEVVMPQMGESIAEGTITKWLKKVGERVERDEPLFEISTDKVDAEIPSPAAGTLTEVSFNEGDTVEVNTVVAVLDGDRRQRLQHRAKPVEEPTRKVENRLRRHLHLLHHSKPPPPPPLQPEPGRSSTTTSGSVETTAPPAHAEPEAQLQKIQRCHCGGTSPDEVESARA